MKNIGNVLLCILSVLILLVLVGAIAAALIFLVLVYDSFYVVHTAGTLHIPVSFGSVVFGLLLIIGLWLSVFTVVKLFRIWKNKVIYRGVWCILHDWDGCTCKRCGEKRDTGHYGYTCKCDVCGMFFHPEQHIWNGCKCKVCGKERDEQHAWNGCKCEVCGRERDEQHAWNGCRCEICGKERNEGHDWDQTQCVCKRCGRRNHDWKLISEKEESEEYFPEGVDPCTENLFFLEKRNHTVKEYKCQKCHHTMQRET